VSNSASPPEETALKKVARQYSAEGYDVVIEPTRADLPEPLRDFVIDLLAKRGEETVIIEVRRSTSGKADPKLQALAEAISHLPNYRFDFIAVAQQPKHSSTDLLTREELLTRVREAGRLEHMGSTEASIMLLWSATEGALRLLAAQEHVSARAQNPSALIKNLYSEGVLDKSQYGVLERAVQYRNAAAHGYRIDTMDETFLQSWSELSTNLLMRVRRHV
jgi:uncharacterized protein YutE (UPF0331/DUF86 family)